MDSQTEKPHQRRSAEENNRTVVATAGAGAFGASIAGLPGAIIGAIIGLVSGEWANEEKRKKK